MDEPTLEDVHGRTDRRARTSRFRDAAVGKIMYEHCIQIGQIPSLTLVQMERKAAKQHEAKARESDLDGTLVPVLPT